MVSTGHQDELYLYASLLKEALFRFTTIDRLTDENIAIPTVTVRESCFLQIRMICELIALCCLVAHGDIVKARNHKLTKKYQADLILKELEKLHQNFFPQPMESYLSENGLPAIKPRNDTAFISKAELISLYHLCGEKLHRGTFDNLKQYDPNVADKYEDIITFSRKIAQLLRYHIIMSEDGETYYQCLLIDPTIGAPTVTIYSRFAKILSP